MTKIRTALIGMSAALLCGMGAAQAQDFSRSDEVITYPGHIEIVKQPGKLSALPVAISVSRDVSTADLNLATESGNMELYSRVSATARDLCAELDVRFPQFGRDRECVRTATRNAMRSAPFG